MSESEDFAAYPAERSNGQLESLPVLTPIKEEQQQGSTSREEEIMTGSIDEQSYVLGEVPQPHLSDPQAFLPLDSDRLSRSGHGIEGMMSEVDRLVQEEMTLIQRLQKRIHSWEERMEKNRSIVAKNDAQIKQNKTDISYDKKNRDYWMGRAEQVLMDYQDAESAGRANTWEWLIKKYGLKDADGEAIECDATCVEELCNGEANNLAGEYQQAGNRYEQSRKDKEQENGRLIRENSKLLNMNETLQSYVAAAYSNEMEPLQDGVLLMKELGVKLKALSQDESASYGDLRVWADGFLSEFLKSNPRVLLHIVTNFRAIASIPLPTINS